MTIDTTDRTTVGSYVMWIVAKWENYDDPTYDEVIAASGVSKRRFEIEILDPCLSASLYIYLAIVDYDYIIGETAIEIAITDAAITSSETCCSCPSDYVFSMTSSTDEEYSGIVFSLSEDDSGEFSIARRRILATSTSYTLRIETLSPS